MVEIIQNPKKTFYLLIFEINNLNNPNSETNHTKGMKSCEKIYIFICSILFEVI